MCRKIYPAKALIYTSLIDKVTDANGKVIDYEVSRFLDAPTNFDYRIRLTNKPTSAQAIIT